MNKASVVRVAQGGAVGLASTHIIAVGVGAPSAVRQELEGTVMCLGVMAQGLARHLTLMELVDFITDSQLRLSQLAHTPWDGLYDWIRTKSNRLMLRPVLEPTACTATRDYVERTLVRFNRTRGFDPGAPSVRRNAGCDVRSVALVSVG